MRGREHCCCARGATERPGRAVARRTPESPTGPGEPTWRNGNPGRPERGFPTCGTGVSDRRMEVPGGRNGKRGPTHWRPEEPERGSPGTPKRRSRSAGTRVIRPRATKIPGDRKRAPNRGNGGPEQPERGARSRGTGSRPRHGRVPGGGSRRVRGEPAHKDPVAGDGGCTSNRAMGTVTRDRLFANSISAFPVTDLLVRDGSCPRGGWCAPGRFRRPAAGGTPAARCLS